LSSQLFSSLGKLGLKLEYRKRVPVQYLTLITPRKNPLKTDAGTKENREEKRRISDRFDKVLDRSL
jgi:hypothetical protein